MKYIFLLTLFLTFSSDANETKAIFSAFNIALESFTTTFDPKPKSVKEAIRMAHETVERTKIGEKSGDMTAQGWKNLGDQALALSVMFYELSQQDKATPTPFLEDNLVFLLSFIEQINGGSGYFSRRVSQLKSSE